MNILKINQPEQTGMDLEPNVTKKKQTKTKDPNHFTETLISIDKECIPKSPIPNKCNRPWFDDNCKEAIRLLQVALHKINTQPSASNLIFYKL